MSHADRMLTCHMLHALGLHMGQQLLRRCDACWLAPNVQGAAKTVP